MIEVQYVYVYDPLFFYLIPQFVKQQYISLTARQS